MATTFRLQAPKGMALHKMSEEEVKKFVAEEAGRMLDQLPKDYRPIGINAVALESVQRQADDWGVWGQWTRACCDRRRRIEDFEEPIEQVSAAAQRHFPAQELDSAMRVERILLGPTHTERARAKKAR